MLGAVCQELFLFEWYDPEKGINRQLTWTRLPQGFNNSPTILNESLHEYVGEFQGLHPELSGFYYNMWMIYS